MGPSAGWAEGLFRLPRRAVVVCVLMLACSEGWPQSAPVPPGPPPATQPQPQSSPSPPAPERPPSPAPPAPPPAFAPGLIDRLGDLVRESVDGVSSNLKGAKGAIDSINKGASDALTRLPGGGIAVGRAACARSANGAPDCQGAIDSLCRSKGYASGASLSTETAENCAARVYVPGYQRREGDCTLDTYVTRAACN